MDISGILNLLSGAKTYIVAVIAIIAVVVNHVWPQPWLNLDPANWLQDLWTWFLVITGRSAASNVATTIKSAIAPPAAH